MIILEKIKLLYGKFCYFMGVQYTPIYSESDLDKYKSKLCYLLKKKRGRAINRKRKSNNGSEIDIQEGQIEAYNYAINLLRIDVDEVMTRELEKQQSFKEAN